MDELDFNGWSILFDDVQPILVRIAKYSGARALTQVEVTDQNITNLVNEDAVAWANERAAEMVGKKWVDGKLVDNPNASWAITESTREYLRGTVTDAMEEGWSPQKLTKELEDNTAFSKSRAKMIARTETAFADCNGRMIGYKNSGLNLGKQWIVGSGACEKCAINKKAGVIGLDDAFPSGNIVPPAHPHCRCDVIPVLLDNDPVTKFSESEHPRDKKGRFAPKNTNLRTGKPNSHIDVAGKNGIIKERWHYDKNGHVNLSIHNTNHGNAKTHPIVPHAHDWKNGEPDKGRPLTDDEYSQNKDMFGGG
ncbi:MAG: phage putative head morphosis protein, gp7 family [Firmicutes bacterium]|nr:phage putative head morphosis protein, gp7 family [Bacillota bacterium]